MIMESFQDGSTNSYILVKENKVPLIFLLFAIVASPLFASFPRAVDLESEEVGHITSYGHKFVTNERGIDGNICLYQQEGAGHHRFIVVCKSVESYHEEFSAPIPISESDYRYFIPANPMSVEDDVEVLELMTAEFVPKFVTQVSQMSNAEFAFTQIIDSIESLERLEVFLVGYRGGCDIASKTAYFLQCNELFRDHPHSVKLFNVFPPRLTEEFVTESVYYAVMDKLDIIRFERPPMRKSLDKLARYLLPQEESEYDSYHVGIPLQFTFAEKFTLGFPSNDLIVNMIDYLHARMHAYGVDDNPEVWGKASIFTPNRK